MPDPLTWYAALVGSGATLVATRREVLQRRVRVRVDHGWRYFQTQDSPPQFDNLMVYFMVTNTGGRNVVVRHVGWEFLVDSGERTPEGGRALFACRAEVPLKEPKVVEPDGVPLKVEAWAGSLAHLFDPIDIDVRPVAFTGGGNVRWEGPSGPLSQRVPASFDLRKMRERIEELKASATQPVQMGSPGLFYVDPIWAEGTKDDARPVEAVSSEPLLNHQRDPSTPGT